MSSPTKQLRPRNIAAPHAQQTIRDSTMQLSSLSLRSPLSSYTSDSFIFPSAVAEVDDQESIAASSVAATDSVTDLTASSTPEGAATPRGRPLQGPSSAQAEPSGLSLLLAKRNQSASSRSSSESLATPTAARPYPTPAQIVVTDDSPATGIQHAVTQSSERAPLLDVEAARPSYGSTEANGDHQSAPVSKRDSKGVVPRWKGYSPSARLGGFFTSAVRALPAVILGTLLNILDGISCTCIRRYPSLILTHATIPSRWYDCLSCSRCIHWARWGRRVHVLRLVSGHRFEIRTLLCQLNPLL